MVYTRNGMKRDQDGYRYILDIQTDPSIGHKRGVLLFKAAPGIVRSFVMDNVEVDALLNKGELSIPDFACEEVDFYQTQRSLAGIPETDFSPEIGAIIRMRTYLMKSDKYGIPSRMVFRPTFVRDLKKFDWIRLERLVMVETDKGIGQDFHRETGQVTIKYDEFDFSTSTDFVRFSVDGGDLLRLHSRHHVEVFTVELPK